MVFKIKICGFDGIDGKVELGNNYVGIEFFGGFIVVGGELFDNLFIFVGWKGGVKVGLGVGVGVIFFYMSGI